MKRCVYYKNLRRKKKERQKPLVFISLYFLASQPLGGGACISNMQYEEYREVGELRV